MIRNILILCFLLPCISIGGKAQPKRVTLTLSEAVQQAKAHSLKSLAASNDYIADYWTYRQYKASLLPSLTLGSTPVEYFQNLTKRYDSQQDIDVYKSQRNLYSRIGLRAAQVLPFTGGTLSLESDWNYLQNFGANGRRQFTTVPLRLRYAQELFGYNRFKWDRKLEPKRFAKARQDLLYGMEDVACQATSYFYQLVLEQKGVELCEDNVAQCDTACQIAEERFKIGTATRAQTHTARLNLLNARKALRESRQRAVQSQQRLLSFLRYDETSEVRVIPQKPEAAMLIDADEAIARAKENNPDMLRMEVEELEGRKQLDQVKKSRFSTSVSASVGLNQSARRFGDAYANPLHQEAVSVSVNIPILDWGTHRGKVITAAQRLNATMLQNRQAIEDFEQDVAFTVGQFHESHEQIALSEEAEKAARMAYSDTYQQFLSGKSDVDALWMAQSRLNEAGRSYIQALSNYWNLYYKLRRMTLFDFRTKSALDVDTEHLIR